MKITNTKKKLHSVLLFVSLILGGTLQAQSTPLKIKNLDIIARSHQISLLGECKKVFSDCERIFELTLLKDTDDIRDKLIGAAVFGTLYEMASACNSLGKIVCDIVSAAFNDRKDECLRFNPSYTQLCSDIKNFRLSNCERVKDVFLASICLKKLLPACRNDTVCLVSWTYFFREDAERLRTAPIELQNSYSELYKLDKESVTDSLNTIVRIKTTLQTVVRAPMFPAPSLIKEFKISRGLTKQDISAKKMKLGFKPLTIVKNAFVPSMRELLTPWKKGEGITVADWDADGYLDVFTVDGDNILFFENINGEEFRKFSIDLTYYGLEGYLSDISVADIDGDGIPAIIVQSFPNKVYVLRWIKEKSSFSTEIINLPNTSLTHSYIKFKKGLGIIFSGWNGISTAKNPLASDYVARVDSEKKWSFEKIVNSEVSTLGLSVIETAKNGIIVAISRGETEGTTFYKVVDDNLVKLPGVISLNYLSHSTAYLQKSNGEDVWISSGVGFYDGKGKQTRTGLIPPKDIEECKKWTGSGREYCVLRFEKSYINEWTTLCSLFKKKEYVKLCEMQNETVGIKNMKQLFNEKFDFGGQVFTNLQSPIIDEASSKLISEMGQVWHMSPLKSPSMEGFLLGEAHTNPKIQRKLWWMPLEKSGSEKIELTNNLNLSEKYDATHFSLGDFDRDGELDMVFKSGKDLIFLKGETGGYSGLENNLQSGHLSKTFIKIPSNLLQISAKE